MYTNTQTNQFPYTDNDLRKDNPNVSFPKDITDDLRAEFDMFPVVAAPIIEGKTQVSSTCENIDGVWTQVIEWVGPTQDELVGYMKARRYQAEIAGIVVDGAKIATDRESQAMISGAYAMALRDESRVFSWQTDTGTVTLDASTLIAVAVAVGNHVQACFDAQSDVWAQITAGTITTAAEIDAYDWPAS